MQIRSFFISNSSSTSFIVAQRHQNECCPTCGIYIDFLQLVQEISTYNYDDLDKTDMLANTYKDILDYLKAEQLKEDEIKAIEEKLLTYRDSVIWKLALIKISYNDTVLKNLFDILEEKKKLIIIEEI